MENIKTFEGFLDFLKSETGIEGEVQDISLSEEEIAKRERKELEEKTRKSISLAQRNGSPTYYDHVRKTTETTPSISSKKQSLRNMRRGMK